MDNKHLIEDHILLFLLSTATAEDDPVPEVVYGAFRPTFRKVFEGIAKLSEADCDDLAVRAFAIFLLQVEDGMITRPLEAKLLVYLLRIGEVLLESKPEDWAEKFRAALAKVPSPPVSNALVTLIAGHHPVAEQMICEDFKTLICNYLIKLFREKHKEPASVYNIAMGEGIRNIREKKLVPPMRSTLITYFTHIAIYMLSNETKKFYAREDQSKDYGTELENDPHFRETPGDYYDFLLEEHKWLDLYFGVEDLDGLYEKIIKLAGPPLADYLHMLYVENLSYNEIVERLQQTGVTIKAGTLRKRVCDGLKKIKIALNLKEDEQK